LKNTANNRNTLQPIVNVLIIIDLTKTKLHIYAKNQSQTNQTPQKSAKKLSHLKSIPSKKIFLLPYISNSIYKLNAKKGTP